MNLWQDVRFALRLLIKDKWFTAVAVIALALGIGVNATVFTFVNAVLIRGLPFNDPDRIVIVASPTRAAAIAARRTWTSRTGAPRRGRSALSASSGATMNISEEGRTPERFHGNYVRERVRADRPAAAARPRFPAGGRSPGRRRGGDPGQRRLQEPLRQRSVGRSAARSRSTRSRQP